MENTIEFDHFYSKIGLAYGCTRSTQVDHPSKLIEVLEVRAKDLSPEFIVYDTVYLNLDAPNTLINPIMGQYKLRMDRTYLLLIFLGPRGIFTTLRRKTPESREEYRGKIGEDFNIFFKNDIMEKSNFKVRKIKPTK